MTLRQEVLDYVKKKYGTLPERPWARYPENEVLRHAARPGAPKPKWYGIIMPVKRSAFGQKSDEYVDVLNVKLSEDSIDFLRHVDGYYPAYHMNKQHWISILLDGTVPMENIKMQLGESFELTEGKK